MSGQFDPNSEKQMFFLFPRPSSGFNGRYYTTAGGMVSIDFEQGQAKVVDTSQNPSPKGDGIWQLGVKMPKVRSMLIYVSDGDAVIRIDGRPLMNDMQLWHLIENVDCSGIQIEFPRGKKPDAFGFMILASNYPYMGYKNNFITCHDVKILLAQTSTNNNTVNYERHIFGYDNFILVTKNTDAANAITITAEESPDETNFYPIFGYPKNLAAGQVDELDVLVKYHYVRISVKDASAGNHATYEQVFQVAK